MGYYDQEENVREYIKMSRDYSSKHLIDILKTFLPPKTSLLELGMGAGKDLLELSKTYKVMGSDSSQAFLDLFSKEHPEIETMHLDVSDLNLDKSFDGIYSNKVLYHLPKKIMCFC